MKNVKTIFCYLIAFLVLYIQPLTFGPVKGSVITQIILFSVLGYNLISKSFIRLDSISRTGVMVASKVLVSPFIYSYFKFLLVDFFKFSIFPLFYIYISTNVRHLCALKKVILFFSKFVVISSLPFLLNIMKPVVEGYRLDIFGEDNINGFVGVFQNSHTAGVVLSLAIINLFYFSLFEKSKKEKCIMLFLITFGIYVLYKTYVRTGYLTLSIGFFTVYLCNIKRISLFKHLLLLFACVAIPLYIYSSDVILQNRLQDKSQYTTGSKVNDLGSGRLLFQFAAFDIWSESHYVEKIFGIGVEKLTEEMEKKVSLKIHTHNGFTDALVKDGLLGLFLFIGFLIAIFHKIVISHSRYKILTLATFLSYFFFQVVQGGIISPLIEIFLVFNVALLNFEVKENSFVPKHFFSVEKHLN